jgi:uncharacterized sodium:solute symporter family permease YidK
MGSAGAARLVAHMAFFCLLLLGWFSDELSRRAAAVMVGLWVAGYVGSAYVPQGDMILTSYVAILDIVLVLLVFKGDVRLH